ncbi:MAG: ferric reductase-like transmembrane domain-containing protein [Acidimicrobiales bacterium]
MPDQIWWYLARSSGMVTLAASGGAVIWGLLLSTRLIRKPSLPKWLLDLHRFLGTITVAALVLHIAALVADTFVHFGPADILVPFHSHWRTVGVAWGVIAAYIVVIVELTSLVKRRLPLRVWRRIHVGSLGAFALSVLHAATAGSDTSNRIYVVLAFALCAVVLFLALMRVLASNQSPRRPLPTP